MSSEVKINPLGLQEMERVAPEVPRIFEMINSGASTEELLKQISEDAGQSEPDMEKVYLGIEELVARPDRRKSLFSLSNRNDRVGLVAKIWLEEASLNAEQVEDLLGIKRFGLKVESDAVLNDMGVFKKMYEHGIKNGYINPKLGVRECHEKMRNFYIDHPEDDNPHLSGSIEDQLLTFSSTFGANEASYIELNGPKEILRLRTLKDPNFLLIGSLGTYSAGHFENYASKISPRIKTSVIDVDHDMAQRLKKDKPERNVVTGDATLMPFADESIDHIYTNYLFHFFDYDTLDSQGSVEDLMAEAARVLKPGGSIVIVERSYGFHRIINNRNALVSSIDSAAGWDLYKAAELPETLSFSFTKENSSSIIDQNGFGHYEGRVIEKRDDNVSLRYVKE